MYLYVNFFRSCSRNNLAGLENTWFFFHTTLIPTSSFGFKGLKQREVFAVVLINLSSPNAFHLIVI